MDHTTPLADEPALQVLLTPAHSLQKECFSTHCLCFVFAFTRKCTARSFFPSDRFHCFAFDISNWKYVFLVVVYFASTDSHFSQQLCCKRSDFVLVNTDARYFSGQSP